MASLCFCPPERFTTELVPIKVSSFFSNPKTNSALALTRAYSIWSSEASRFPKSIFSLIVPIMSVGSYGTYPIDSLSFLRVMVLISVPSKQMLPKEPSGFLTGS